MARLLALVLLLFPATLLAQDDIGTIPYTNPPVYALTGATVVVGNGQTLTGATVIIRDGLIEAVGSGEIPAGAWEMDLSGMFVYPGMIDALTHNGLKKPPQPAQQQGQQGRPGQQGGPRRGLSDEGPGYFAHIDAADHLDLSSQPEDWRSSGVLTWHVAPDEGIFQGTTAVVNLGWGDADSSIINSGVAQKMAYQGLGFRTYPGSLMGVIAHIRQTLLDAQHYGASWDIYSRNKRGMKRPHTDRTLQSLQPVLDGSMPLLFPADEEREIRRSIALAAEFGAACIIAGGFEAPAVSDLLKEKHIPVLVSLKYPRKPRDPHPEDEESLDALRYRLNAPRAAGRLHEAGVRFSFFSDGVNARDFLQNLRLAVDEGLPRDAALRAATLTAAEILGVGDQLGSIEAGKIANLVVSDADLFDSEAQIRHIFVDGVHQEFPAKEKKKPSAAMDVQVDMTGAWDASVETPGGTMTMTFKLQQQGDSLAGDVTSEAGTANIFDGSITGSDFSFKIEFNMQGASTEVTFSGTLSGDSLSGTATVAGMGSAPLEGRRVP